jgi:hypothetical protein
MEELVNENTFINEDAIQLMKFHGSYQQDHREKRAFGQGKFYQFMMRTRQPSGLVTNQLYLVMDDLADKVRMHAWRPWHLLHDPMRPCIPKPLPPCCCHAVWQWHPAPDHPPGLPAPRRAQARP